MSRSKASSAATNTSAKSLSALRGRPSRSQSGKFVSARGNTAAQAMEEQRRKRHELEAHALGLAPRNENSEVVTAAEPPSVRKLIDRYLDQIKTLKKPNTHRKYDAILTRFAKVFDRRTLGSTATSRQLIPHLPSSLRCRSRLPL